MADFDDPFGFFPRGEDMGEFGALPMDIPDRMEGVVAETAELEKSEGREGWSGDRAAAAQTEEQTWAGQPNVPATSPIDDGDGPETKVANGLERKTFYLLTHSWSNKGKK